MRDVSDVTEELCEDTMMNCEEGDGDEGGGGGGLLDLNGDVADSSPTIRDAAERFLTLFSEDHDDLISSSEDEGVELDDLEDEQENARFLHELAASLVMELKQQSHQKQTRIPTRSFIKDTEEQNIKDKRQKQEEFYSLIEDQDLLESYQCFDTCSRTNQQEEESYLMSWNAGWDACATEALRYLVEDEGLHPHHPTVLAMKNHLDLQRERAFFSRYTA